MGIFSNEIQTNPVISDKYLSRNSVNDVTVRFSLLERNSQDEVTKIWDNIHDLHELANLTTKNVDEIYDKDILKMQNFQIIVEGELTKLKTELGKYNDLSIDRFETYRSHTDTRVNTY